MTVDAEASIYAVREYYAGQPGRFNSAASSGSGISISSLFENSQVRFYCFVALYFFLDDACMFACRTLLCE